MDLGPEGILLEQSFVEAAEFLWRVSISERTVSAEPRTASP